jgi:hypothetical protein
MPTRLRDLVVTRVAFVPKGDNPAAEILLWKSDRDVSKRSFSADERKALAAKGWALPDGSYPIENGADLANAIQALGRGNTPSAVVKRHIIKQARRLGLVARLPEDWNVAKEAAVAKEPRFTRSRLARLRNVRGQIDEVLAEVDGGEEEQVDDTAKQYELPDDTPEDVRAEFAKLHADLDASREELEKAKAKEGSEQEPEPDPIEKADPEVRGIIEELRKSAEQATADAQAAKAETAAMRKEQATAAAIEKARDLKHLSVKPEELGVLMQKIQAALPEDAAEVERILRSADATASEAFREIGKGSGEAEGGDSYEKLQEMGREIAKRDGVPESVGFSKALETDEGKALHREYVEEVNGR